MSYRDDQPDRVPDGPEDSEQKFPAWKGAYVLSIIYLLYFIDCAARTVIGPLFPLLKEDLKLSDPQLGLLSTVFLVALFILVLPLSYLADRWKRSKLISIMAVIWSFATLFSGLSQSFNQLLLSRVMLGVAESSYPTASIALISAMFSRAKRAMVIGFWNTSNPLGMAVGAMLGGVIAAHFGWRAAFMAVAVPGFILGVLAWFLPDFKVKMKSEDSIEKSVMKPGAAMKSIFSNKTLMAVCVSYGILNIMQMSIVYWLPSYLNRFLGMGVDQAGLLAGSMFLSALIANPAGGWLADRWSRRDPRGKMYLASLCVLFSGIFLASGIYLKAVELLFLGAFINMFYVGAVYSTTQDVVPLYHRSLSFGAFTLSAYILGAWGPLISGFISKAADLQVALLASTFFAIPASFGFYFASRYYISDFKSAREKEVAAGAIQQLQGGAAN